MEESLLKDKNLMVLLKYDNKEPEITVIAREQSIKPKNGTYLTDIQENDRAITINKSTVQQLTIEGQIPPDISTHLLAFFENHEKTVNLSNQLNNSTNLEDKELYQKQLEKTLMPNPQDISDQLAAMRHLLEIKNFLESEHKIPHEFYKNIDKEKCFGMLKVLTDRLKYIPELLQQSDLLELAKGSAYSHRVQSTMKLKDIGEIGLSYSFTPRSSDTLIDEFNKYVDDMNDAIKVLLAYWAYATAMGNFQYLAPITEIMSVAKNINRQSRWSVTEKQRFWELSKLLENTMLTFKYKIGQEWIDVKTRLLDLSITSSYSKDQETKKGYVDKVMPIVLNSVLKKTAYLVTEISKGTLLLRPEDILLALYPQSRASQRSTSTSTRIDENYAMELAGLKGTYESNSRMARKKLKEKLNKITAADSIAGWEKVDDGYLILHFRQPKVKNKKISPKT